jgi:hypothetical protein
MLTSVDEKTTYKSDGTTKQTPVAQIMLADCHAEYTGDWPKRFGSWPDDYAYMRMIDVSAIEDVHDAITGTRSWENDEEHTKRWNDVWEFLFPGFIATLDMDPNSYACFYTIEGDPGGHHQVFVDLRDKLDVVPSGDDDFFDYWPNTMDMLWTYACDLDAWEDRAEPSGRPHEGHQNMVRKLFTKVWDAVGPDNSLDAGDLREEWLGHDWAKWLVS